MPCHSTSGSPLCPGVEMLVEVGRHAHNVLQLEIGACSDLCYHGSGKKLPGSHSLGCWDSLWWATIWQLQLLRHHLLIQGVGNLSLH